MEFLYGKPIAEETLKRLKKDISSNSKKPGLAVILVGNNKASRLYVSLKEKAAGEIGMNFFRFNFLKNVKDNEIIDLIGKLNSDKKINGIILQLPLPKGFDSGKIISKIDPKKDADGFHPQNANNFLKGSGKTNPVFPRAIMLLAESSRKVSKEKKAIIAANSDEFGKIMAATFEQKKISAEYFLSKDIKKNLKRVKNADIVVSAVGKPGFISGEMLKPGCIIVDGGIKKIGKKVFGDIDSGSVQEVASFLTPVPGGVGPLTIACLLENVYLAFKAQTKKKNN